MGRRKTAQRGPASKKDPESKRRWVIVHAATGKPTIGNDEGVSDEAKAHRLSDSYLMETKVVPLWEYRGEPDPDLVEDDS